MHDCIVSSVDLLCNIQARIRAGKIAQVNLLVELPGDLMVMFLGDLLVVFFQVTYWLCQGDLLVENLGDLLVENLGDLLFR